MNNTCTLKFKNEKLNKDAEAVKWLKDVELIVNNLDYNWVEKYCTDEIIVKK